MKVAPGASGDCIVGWLGDTLKIRVSAPPEKGKANVAVAKLLADFLNTPVRNISVCSGQTARTKVFEISGMSESELQGRFDEFKS